MLSRTSTHWFCFCSPLLAPAFGTQFLPEYFSSSDIHLVCWLYSSPLLAKKKTPKKPKSYTNKRTWTKTVRLHVYHNCNKIIKLYVNEVICMAEKKSQKLYKLTNKHVPRLSNYTNIRTAIRLSNLYVYKLIFLNEKIVKILCFSFLQLIYTCTSFLSSSDHVYS